MCSIIYVRHLSINKRQALFNVDCLIRLSSAWHSNTNHIPEAVLSDRGKSEIETFIVDYFLIATNMTCLVGNA